MKAESAIGEGEGKGYALIWAAGAAMAFEEMGERGVVAGVMSLTRPGGDTVEERSIEDAAALAVTGCRSDVEPLCAGGEVSGCIVFMQWPLLAGRQLVQWLPALAHTQDLHFPPPLQRQQTVIFSSV